MESGPTFQEDMAILSYFKKNKKHTCMSSFSSTKRKLVTFSSCFALWALMSSTADWTGPAGGLGTGTLLPAAVTRLGGAG